MGGLVCLTTFNTERSGGADRTAMSLLSTPLTGLRLTATLVGSMAQSLALSTSHRGWNILFHKLSVPLIEFNKGW